MNCSLPLESRKMPLCGPQLCWNRSPPQLTVLWGFLALAFRKLEESHRCVRERASIWKHVVWVCVQNGKLGHCYMITHVVSWPQCYWCDRVIKLDLLWLNVPCVGSSGNRQGWWEAQITSYFMVAMWSSLSPWKSVSLPWITSEQVAPPAMPA